MRKKASLKKLTAILLAGSMALSLAGCGDNGSGTESSTPPSGNSSAAENSGESASSSPDGELVDGKFAETRKITVEIYARNNDGGSDPTDNRYTQYIKDGMLERYNVEVEFQTVPRWTEVDEINNLLAAGDAPDICITYSYPTIQTYAAMGGYWILPLLWRITRTCFPICGIFLGKPIFIGTGIPIQENFGQSRPNGHPPTATALSSARTGLTS